MTQHKDHVGGLEYCVMDTIFQQKRLIVPAIISICQLANVRLNQHWHSGAPLVYVCWIFVCAVFAIGLQFVVKKIVEKEEEKETVKKCCLLQ